LGYAIPVCRIADRRPGARTWATGEQYSIADETAIGYEN
jgi:hypothetical protein